MSRSRVSVEDRMDIAELFARCHWAWDCGDAAGVADTFTSDGVMQLPDGSRHQGRAAIIAMVERSTGQGFRGTQHHVNHLLYEGDGQRCTVRCYYASLRLEAETERNYIKWLGQLITHCIKREDGWHIEERQAHRWRDDGLPWKGR